ncbi:MAG: signal peptidase II [Candidatus Krumholzibacteriia bacterium]
MGFVLPAVIVVILDQVTKQFFWHLGRNFDVIDGFFRVTLVRNSGAAFGMLQDGRGFLIVMSVLASILIIFVVQRLPAEQLARRVFLGMILGGALGNLIDRIYPGQVIDFIDMGIPAYRWPVYNIADSAVTIGGVLLILSVSRSRDGGEE